MRQRLTFLAAFCSIVGLLPSRPGVALVSGVYQTLPGATAEEFGDRVPDRKRTLPISATLRFDLNAAPPALTAFIPNAVLEGGDPFPLTVRSSSGGQLPDGAYEFRGDYLGEFLPDGSQYLFDWQFSTSTNGEVKWDGSVGWAGGHIWYLTISNLTLVSLAHLILVRAGPDSLHITWSTNLTDYFLESATNLAAASWNTVTNPTTITGDHFSVIIDIDAPRRFYRIHKP